MTAPIGSLIPRLGDVPRVPRRLRHAMEQVAHRTVWAALHLVDGHGHWLVRLDESDLLATARRRAGGAALADTTFLEPLRRLLDSLQTEARLNLFGRIAARQDIVRLLTNRLRLERDRGRFPDIAAQRIRGPIVITGVPRSGSTLLHALLAQDRANRTPQSWEMLDPSPPPERATYDTDPRIAAAERQMRWFQLLAPQFRTIHAIGARQPEECVMILAHSLMGSQFCSMFGVSSYQSWLATQDLGPAYRLHRHFLQHLQWRCAGERWVLKAPAHMAGLGALLTVYPDAGVIMTHREPLEVLPSEASLQVVLRGTFSDASDPLAIGREVTQSLASALHRGLQVRDSGCVPAEQFYDVQYRDLLDDPLGVVRRLYAHFDWRLAASAELRMRDFLTRNPKDKNGPHEYSLHEFGLNAREEGERYGAYRQRFLHGPVSRPPNAHHCPS
jgi:hypothetical protein